MTTFFYSTDKKRDTLRKKSRRHQSESPDRKRDKSKSKKSRSDKFSYKENDKDKSHKRKETNHEEKKRHHSITLRSESASPIANDSQTVEYVTFESNTSPRNSPYPQTGPDGQIIYRHRHQSNHNPDKVCKKIYSLTEIIKVGYIYSNDRRTTQ